MCVCVCFHSCVCSCGWGLGLYIWYSININLTRGFFERPKYIILLFKLSIIMLLDRVAQSI